MIRQFWSSTNLNNKYGPFDTREAAIQAAIAENPKAKRVTSGYGSEGPWFDIQWTDNPARFS